MTYIVRDKNNKELLVTDDEDEAYKRADIEKGDTVDEQQVVLDERYNDV